EESTGGRSSSRSAATRDLPDPMPPVRPTRREPSCATAAVESKASFHKGKRGIVAPALSQDDVLEKTLARLRDEIDAIDSQILELLNQRTARTNEVGRAKAVGGATPFVPGRELEIFERLE